MIIVARSPTLFPYTTLFRSRVVATEPAEGVVAGTAVEREVLHTREVHRIGWGAIRTEEHTPERQAHSGHECRHIPEERRKVDDRGVAPGSAIPALRAWDGGV